MIAAVPKLKIHEIFEAVSVMAQELNANDFALRLRESELAKLMASKAVEPAYYHLVKAMIHSIRGETSDAISSAKSAMALAPSDDLVVANAIHLLSDAGEIMLAIEILTDTAHRFEGNITTLRNAASLAYGLLQFSLLTSLMGKISLISANHAPEASARFRYHRLAESRARELQLSDRDYADRLQTATAAIREAGFQVRRISTLTGDDGCMFVHLHVDGSYSQTAALDFVIADALVEKYDDTGDQMVTFQCLPTSALQEIGWGGRA